MSTLPANEIIVLEIAGPRAKIAVTACTKLENVRALGFRQEGDLLIRAIHDDADRKSLVLELIRLDAIFSSGPGWSPAELLAHYRDQGMVSARYRTIAWSRPDIYSIRISE